MSEPPAPPPESPAGPVETPRPVGSAVPGLRGISLRGRSLREHTAMGTVIATLFAVVLSFLAFIKGFVLAGLLTTTDYGVWGITAIGVSLIVTLRQVGVVDKYVQQDDSDQELAFQRAFTLELLVSGITALIILAALPLLVIVYDEPRIFLPGLLLAANLIGGALQMPLWVFYRRMQFVRQGFLRAIDPVVTFSVSVFLAASGAGYWALFAGVTAGAWAAAIVAVVISPYRLRWRFDWETVRSYWRFSGPLLLANMGGPIIAQVAVMATDAHIGVAAVGALTLAASVSQFSDQVDHVVTGTIYPAICAVKDRTQVLYESFVKTNRLGLMWAVPFGTALSLFSADLIEFGIGERWEPALPLLQTFGLTAAIGHIGYNWHAFFRARGETRPMAVAAIAAAVTFIAVGLPLLFVWGLKGIGVGIVAQMVVHVAFRAYYLQRLFEGFAFLRHALRALLPSVPAAAFVLGARVLEDGERTLQIAVVELAGYLLITGVLTWLFERDLIRELARYARARPAASAA